MVLALRRLGRHVLAFGLGGWLGWHGLFLSLFWIFAFRVQLLSDLRLLLVLLGRSLRLLYWLGSFGDVGCLLWGGFLRLWQLLGFGLLLFLLGEDLTSKGIAGFFSRSR